MGAALRAASGADWRLNVDIECFECESLRVDTQGARWMVLDGDPVGFERPVDFRFLPDAMSTCVFRTGHQGLDCNPERPMPQPKPQIRLWQTPI